MKGFDAFRLGVKLVAGISAGYLACQMMEKKTNKLVENGGVLNAFAIGAGQGAISVVVGTLVYMFYWPEV